MGLPEVLERRSPVFTFPFFPWKRQLKAFSIILEVGHSLYGWTLGLFLAEDAPPTFTIPVSPKESPSPTFARFVLSGLFPEVIRHPSPYFLLLPSA